MLEQALTNVRAAIVLRDCAAHAASAAEARLFLAFAQIYEARARAAITSHERGASPARVPRPSPSAAALLARTLPPAFPQRVATGMNRLATWMSGRPR